MPGFSTAGALSLSWLPISPIIDPDDESAAADLFGPDEGFVDADKDAEPAVASRDIGDGGELRIDCADNVDDHVISQTPVGIPSPSQPTAAEIALHWLTHLP